MNINQVKKLRKIVRIKKLATKNNKIFVCTMKKTSVHYKMVLTIIPCLFFIPLPHFQYREDIYAHPCFQAFPKQFTDDYLSNHLYGQEARKVFIQHPRFNIEVFLKRTKDGWSIIHRHWPKVAKTFNMNEGSIFAFRFSSFPDEMHLSIYRL
jgi:hypothetical protein